MVKCAVCKRTHALQLSAIVNHSQIGLSEQIQILSCYESSGDFAAIMNGHPAIIESNICHAIRQYRACHRAETFDDRQPVTSSTSAFQASAGSSCR